jgi:hypothetical protein
LGMTIQPSYHVDRSRSDVLCDTPTCSLRRSQLLPADATTWPAFLARIGWRTMPMDAGDLHDCPACGGAVRFSDLCQGHKGYTCLEVTHSPPDTRWICKHCNKPTGTHDADPWPRPR